MLALVFLNAQVKVVDRTAVITANAETVVVSPPGLQEVINAETGIFILYPFLFFTKICLFETCEFCQDMRVTGVFYQLRH